MSSMVFACYRPRPGNEDELRQLVKDHTQKLRSLGLITDRDAYLMEAEDGTVVEVFEWSSMEAKKGAHSHPKVLKMWDRFEALTESVPLSSLDEASRVHPNFKPL